MEQPIKLSAQRRDRAGKGAARAVRRSGRVPGVIYGNQQPPTLISLDPRDLGREVTRRGFYTRIFEIDVAGEKHQTLARDVQLDPVSDRPVHVDFMRFGADSRVRVNVEVRFLNEGTCPGIRRGGVLNVVRRTVELSCPASNIPQSIIVDLAELDIGDSVHIRAVKLPEGAKPTIARDFTIATIAAPTVLLSEEEEAAKTAAALAAAAAAAGEVAPEGAPAEGAPAAAGAADKGKAAPEKGKPAEKGKAPEKGKEK